jgi:hypothetical protein
MKFIDSVIDHTQRKKQISCPWKYSFALQTEDRTYHLFAKNEEEQFLWLSAFYRIC